MKKPNIVFLFSDQQRWDTVSCYGQELGTRFGLTPNLDRMAMEGVRFDLAMTCQPVCGPARACIQTGKYPSEIGCQINDMALPQREKTIAHYLKEAGYETAYVGKWHLASHCSPKAGVLPGCVDYRTSAIPRALRGGYEDYWAAADVLEDTSCGYGGYVFDGEERKREFTGYRADAMTDFALEYLQREKKSPFFLFVSYLEPHHQNNHGRFEGPIGSWERFADFFVPGDLKGQSGDWDSQMPDYLGCCKRLDDNVGRIEAELKRQGIYEDTVIVYTSDHGSHFRTRNAEYKRSCHDASIHVPLIVRGPEFLGGKIIRQLTSLIDIAPTILSAAGIAPPESMPGIPLQTLAAHPDVPIHEEVLIQISESCVGRAIRTPEYTYCVEWPGTPQEKAEAERKMWAREWEDSTFARSYCPVYEETLLYDLKKDPFQRDNRIADPEYESVRARLRESLLWHIQKEEGRTAKILKADRVDDKRNEGV